MDYGVVDSAAVWAADLENELLIRCQKSSCCHIRSVCLECAGPSRCCWCGGLSPADAASTVKSSQVQLHLLWAHRVKQRKPPGEMMTLRRRERASSKSSGGREQERDTWVVRIILIFLILFYSLNVLKAWLIRSIMLSERNLMWCVHNK